MTSTEGPERQDLPLCVDLDGTLIRSDLLHDGLARLLTRPADLARVLACLPDRARLKAQLAGLVTLHPERLPYNADLLEFLSAERARGRYLVLATAADAGWARAVAAHLGLFDEVIASEGGHNLKGTAKAAALVARFGERGFDYAGNSADDLPVWRVAAHALVVGAPPGLAEQAQTLAPVIYRSRATARLPALRVALRPHQWLKNLLVFVPILTAHALLRPVDWGWGLLAFAAFCATASAIYLVNDLTDIEADRAHPRKRRRPFASGALPVPIGLAAAVGLLALGLILAAVAGMVSAMVTYAALSLLYSAVLKERPLVDVFVLSGLYTLRIVGGGLATGHVVSLWLLTFSGFLFLGLAIMKRVDELQSAGVAPARRGYVSGDAAMLQAFGIAASFASAVVLTLFVQSETVGAGYRSPTLLWGVVPLLLFWQCRLWLAVARGFMHHDPIVYAARDRVSWAVGAATAAVLIAAKSGLPW